MAPSSQGDIAEKELAMVFSLDNARFTSLNLIPKQFDSKMEATLEYRLVNKLE